jgi:hypothetical protein
LTDTSISKQIELTSTILTTTYASIDKSTTPDSQIITNAITTKQEQTTSKLISLIQSTANEITTTSQNPLQQSTPMTTTDNFQTEPSTTDSFNLLTTDHFTYPTTEIGDTSLNVISSATSTFLNSNSTTNSTSSNLNSTSSMLGATITPQTDDSFETLFLTALFSSVGVIMATVLVMGIVVYCKSKKFSVIHPTGGKNEFIELKKI